MESGRCRLLSDASWRSRQLTSPCICRHRQRGAMSTRESAENALLVVAAKVPRSAFLVAASEETVKLRRPQPNASCISTVDPEIALNAVIYIVGTITVSFKKTPRSSFSCI